MSIELQDIFISYLNATADVDTLLIYRSICRRWNTKIEKCYKLEEIFSRRKAIREILKYDENIYDENTYPRYTLRNNMGLTKNEYRKIRFPGIISVASDFDDEDDFMLLSTQLSSYIDTKIFYSEYSRTPSTKISLCSPEFLKRVYNGQHRLLQDKLCNCEAIDKLVFFNPICYSKHYKKKPKDKQYINLLCYINIIGITHEGIELSECERYVPLYIFDTLKNEKNMEQTIEEHIMDKTIRINENIEDLSDILQNSQTIDSALEIVLNNYYYNL